MILVAGGSGRLGTLVVRRLAADGAEVRVLTRDPARAAHLRDVATIVTGDVRDPATVREAVAGVSTVISAVHGFAGPGRVTPASVDRQGNITIFDAAAAEGADVVMLSVVGASSDHPMELFRAKYAAEQHLRASAAPWTIVRATAFVELWAQLLGKGIVFGRGQNPINFVAVADVAAVVVQAARDRGLRGQVIDVGGPVNMTFNELAAELQRAQGGPARFRHIPRAVLRVMGTFARQPAAAYQMDTIDLRFDPAAAAGTVILPLTDPRGVLGSPQPVTTAAA